MRWLNYHHLYYFWVVAKKGSVTEASKDLRLAQPTISAQIKTFEDSLGERLFEKDGRKLKLTETGQIALRYAEEIFALGNEMFDVVEGKMAERPETLRIGISEVVPKRMALNIIEPVFSYTPTPKIICFEDSTENLLAELTIKHVDIIISDCPTPPNVKVKTYNHLIGESEVAWMGAESLVRKNKKPFPACLDGSPVLLPLPTMTVRRELDRWFEEENIRPIVAGEFQDSALMNIFAKEGHGYIPVPSSIEADVSREFNLKPIGRSRSVKEKFYLISIERKIKHPAVAKIVSEVSDVLKDKKSAAA